jgi:uncharacterized protein
MPPLAPLSTLNSSCEQSLTSEPMIVLDTNAVLDWLLFTNPAMDAAAAAIAGGRVRWIATAALRSEFVHVLGRGLAQTRGMTSATLMETWARYCTEQPTAPPGPAQMRCTDPDDQKFLDLALATGARWLISRDRAVLKLRHRAAALGLAIVPPERWQLE